MTHELHGHPAGSRACARSFLLALIAVTVAIIAGAPRPLAAGTQPVDKMFFDKCEDQTQRKRYQGDYAGALAAVDACLARAPKSGDLLLLRASILQAKDNLEQALATYRQALDAGLDGPSARKVRNIIDALAPIENTQVRVEVENGPANVYVVSRALGVRCVAAPACTIGRLPGRVRVYIEREGFAPVRKRVQVARNRTTELALALDELPSPLHLEVTPPGATVMLDGQALRDASRPRDIEPGEHRLRVERAGFTPHEQLIVARRGQPVRVRVALAERVRVNVSVPAAELFLDGRPVTLEDGMLRLPPGERRAHVVTARAAGHFDATAEIPLERPRDHEVALDLAELPPLSPPSSLRLLAGPPPAPEAMPAPSHERSRLESAAVATTGTLAVAGYAVGAGFAINAWRKWNTAVELCTRDSGPGVVCGADGVEAIETARARTAIAQVSVALGTVSAVGMLAAMHWNEPAPERGGMSRTRVLSMGASAAMAAAATGAGVWYGVQSRSKNEQAQACTDDAACTRTRYVLTAQAADDARLSRLGFAVAGAAAASAAFLWLTAPSGDDARAGSAVRLAPVVGREQVGIGIAGTLP